MLKHPPPHPPVPCYSTVTQFTKADLVDHLGWSKTDKAPKKTGLKGIVEGLAVSAKLFEVVQAPAAPGPVRSELFGGILSFKYLQLEKEKSKLE